MITYTTTWLKGMNTRPTHDVSNSPNGTVGFGETVNIAEVWDAPADGMNVRAGDKWARLDTPLIRWVAVIHLGATYGTLGNNDDPTLPVSDEIVKAVIHFKSGETKELFP